MPQLTIKIDNENVHLSLTTIIPINQTNFPYAHCKLRTNKEVFWEVELLGYDEKTYCWHMEVIGYTPTNTSSFAHQRSTKTVARIMFERFDWGRLERQLSSYQKSAMGHMLYNLNNGRFDFPDPETRFYKNPGQQSFIEHWEQRRKELDMPSVHSPQIETHRFSLSVDFTDANFCDGHVKFSRKIKDFAQQVDFRIDNAHLRAEFDHIKSWFTKWFRTKRFKVDAVVTLTSGKITEVSASSTEIGTINPELIESMRDQRTVALSKSIGRPELEKSIFTATEIFEELVTGDIEGNVFKQQETDILQVLLNRTRTRNRKQLEYLSGSKQSEDVKLRFTLSPTFGFVFFIEGSSGHHFVWELLQTNATYIWSFDGDKTMMEDHFGEVEAAIAFIRQHGREPYKRKYKEEKIKLGFSFSAIDHDDVNSETEEGLIKWKHKLEAVINNEQTQ